MSEPVAQERPAYLLLTGASSGIGREMAVVLSKQYRLILNGRDRQRLEETRLTCCVPEEQLVWAADLADVESLDAALPAFLLFKLAAPRQVARPMRVAIRPIGGRTSTSSSAATAAPVRNGRPRTVSTAICSIVCA